MIQHIYINSIVDLIDPCARYISIISDGDEVDMKRIENLVPSSLKIDKITVANALGIIDLSRYPVHFYENIVVTKRVLRSSQNKDEDPFGFNKFRSPSKGKHKQQNGVNYKQKNAEIASGAKAAVNSSQRSSDHENKSVAEKHKIDSKVDLIEETDGAKDSTPQEINNGSQSAINPEIYQNLEKDEYIKQLSLIIKGIHESSIRNRKK